MMDAGRHPKIDLHTYSEIEGVSGYVGNFTVTVRKKARYVDESVCTSCADCVGACPVTVPSEFDMGLADRKAIYRSFAQAVPNAFVIDKRGPAPCKNACPAGIHVQGYVALISEGRFREAYELIRERLPFAGICGRVCHHPCEEVCRRGETDQPVAIQYLKRFAADWVAANPESAGEAPIMGSEVPLSLEGHKVAIVGSGPAGLTVARDLAREGVQCHIYEQLPVPGGMMAVGIPRYRLPVNILEREIEDIVSLPRVTLYLSTAVRMDSESEGRPSLSSLRRDYDAVFLGVGCHQSFRLDVPGEELEGVLHGATYLRQVNLAQMGAEGAGIPEVGSEVVVVGGGNVAIDSAMTARRMGAEHVTILYRRTRDEMPANDWEIEDALEEGVEFSFLASPLEMVGKNGSVSEVLCQRMRLGEPDESGRRRPVPEDGHTFALPANTVIVAIGQTLEQSIPEMDHTRRGRIAANPITLQTLVPGVFAGGDAVTGPASVVEAVGAGHRAAESIRRLLLGEDMAIGRSAGPVDVSQIDYYDPAKWDLTPRHEARRRPLQARNGFEEVRIGFSEGEAVAEAKRCLSCAVCSECMACVSACGVKAIKHDAEDEILDINAGAIVVATGFDDWDPSPMPEYGYGIYPEVYTSLEVERLSSASGPTGGEIVMRNGEPPQRVALIHCVGSRDERYQPYCSRFCCMYSLKQAHLVRDKTHAEVFEFYMDIRAFGKGYEEFYERVQEEGVTFVRGRGAEVELLADGKLRVKAEDADLGRLVAADVDMVILANAVVPQPDASRIGALLGLTRTPDGWFAEAHPKLRPVETSTAGIFLAGCAQGPRDVPDTVAHAGAAALEVVRLFNQGEVTISPTVAEVNAALCIGCGECILACPYSAIVRNAELKAEVNPALCNGCGTCAAACPTGAISALHFTNEQLVAQIDALLAPVS